MAMLEIRMTAPRAARAGASSFESCIAFVVKDRNLDRFDERGIKSPNGELMVTFADPNVVLQWPVAFTDPAAALAQC